MDNLANKSPQVLLQEARGKLRVALERALREVQDPAACPMTLGGVMTSLAQEQQGYNAAVMRIPLAVMTQEQKTDAPVDAAAPTESSPDEARPAALISGSNPRKWADSFLAVNKSRAITRESLVDWFAYAIDAGRNDCNHE